MEQNGSTRLGDRLPWLELDLKKNHLARRDSSQTFCGSARTELSKSWLDPPLAESVPKVGWKWAGSDSIVDRKYISALEGNLLKICLASLRILKSGHSLGWQLCAVFPPQESDHTCVQWLCKKKIRTCQ